MSTIKLKRSAVQGKVPVVGDLDLGEVAINTYDGKMYIKKDDGTPAIVEVGGGSGGGTSWQVVANTYTATAGEAIIADTSSGQFTINLPSSPSEGDYVAIADGGNWANTGLIVGRNGSTIEDSADDLELDIPQSKVEFIYDGSTWQIYTNTLSRYSLDNWIFKSSNYNALPNDYIIADTSNGAFTITLPPTPDLGDHVYIADGGDWSNINLTVARNGSTIEGLSEDLIFDLGSVQVHFVYDGATWEVYAIAGPTPAIAADDNSTDATKYITWTDNTSGEAVIKVSSTKLYFNPSTGTLNSTDYNSLSDARLKENVKNLVVDYEVLDNIRSVSFDWKDSGKSAYGFIAQELEEVMPELVNQNENTSYKSISYIQLIPHLLEAIKDLKKRIDELEEKI